jgi:hypothetical protein
MTKKFVVIGPNYWGSGPTEHDALRELRRAGASIGIPFHMYEVEGEFEISPIDGAIWVEQGKTCAMVRKGKLTKSS